MLLLLSANGDDTGLLAESQRSGLSTGHPLSPGLVALEGITDLSALPVLALVRQALPAAVPVSAASVKTWAQQAFESIRAGVPEDQPWRLHVVPHYGGGPVERLGQRAWHTVKLRGAAAERPSSTTPMPGPDAGQNRARLIREAVLELLREKRRHLFRRLVPEPVPFTAADSLVQVLLTSPEAGWLSVAAAPEPLVARRLISPFPKGEVPVAVDKAAPSRAFAKLVEAELRFGHRISAGETCVDLGASPGSWSYVALNRGARVIAVDRAPLREDLMRHPRLTFHQGDAFRFMPERPVDWLLCDVIAAPERSVELVLDWCRRRLARRFIVSLKLRGAADHPKLDRLKQELPTLAGEWYLTHLCANRHEACVFGEVKGT